MMEMQRQWECVHFQKPQMTTSRILSWSFYSNPVVLEAPGGVEVEDEEHIGPVKYNDFVFLMLGADKSLEDKKRKESISS